MSGLPSIELRVPSPLVELIDERLTASGVRVLLKRDDLIHPELPGNKWRKLKYNLEAARAGGHERLLTFGGAYSNHIRATAAAGYYGGFRTIGVIRGEEHLPLNPSLAYATSRGMRLTYLDRTSYRDQRSEEVIAPLRERFGDFFLLPEGGSNADAVRGCAELPAEIDQPFDLLFCAVGTGGTLAGVAAGLEAGQQAVGIPVLKGGRYLSAEVRELQRDAFGAPTDNWSLDCDFHFGGYAKRTSALNEFIEDFQRRHGLRLDWVYVAKMLYAVFAKVGRGEIDHGKTFVALISGSDLIPTV
ncbi:1-aminocyclopropane-1-carboxylate deaminase/D-cysteine desulfhydrase [Kribbella qitaiheensis]|uniref:1-aminocyclopropane-1-carboxylate deaminase/D-cysteine desulfhydrase n=1 Tax=Kribbella qitaiheensis TaxID=1544730 RepID=UPI00361E14BD